MSMLHADGVSEALGQFSASTDPILDEMEARADRDDFPTVGPEVGAFLAWLVRATSATDIFECGSGYGYSAYWMARELLSDAELLLTEIDEDELDDAKTYFERAKLPASIKFHHGDALEQLAAQSTAYDLILLDHENHRYREGFDRAVEQLQPGGTIVVDNVLHSNELDPTQVGSALGDPSITLRSASATGVVELLEHVRTREGVTNSLLPLGEGLLVSTLH